MSSLRYKPPCARKMLVHGMIYFFLRVVKDSVLGTWGTWNGDKENSVLMAGEGTSKSEEWVSESINLEPLLLWTIHHFRLGNSRVGISHYGKHNWSARFAYRPESEGPGRHEDKTK